MDIGDPVPVVVGAEVGFPARRRRSVPFPSGLVLVGVLASCWGFFFVPFPFPPSPSVGVGEKPVVRCVQCR